MRRHAKATSVIAAICGIVLCFGVSPALAGKGVVRFYGENGSKGGQFANSPGGIAVNQAGTGGASTGDIYVVDRGNRRVQELTASGTFVRAFGLDVGGAGVNVCTSAATCTAGTASGAASGLSQPQGLAIDQPTGNVYVSDPGNRRVAVFSATGSFEGAFGWKVDAGTPEEKLQFCTTVSGCQAGSSGADAGQLASQFGNVAVSPLNGHVLVADESNRRIDEFAPTLSAGEVTGVSFVRGYGWGAATGANAFEVCTATCHSPAATGSEPGQFGSNSPADLAVDTTGKVYATDPGNKRVQTFSSTGVPGGVFAEEKLSKAPAPTAVAVDPSNNHVFVVKGCTEFKCPGASNSNELRVLEFDASGTLLETHAEKAGLPSVNGIATVEGGGDIYLSTAVGPGGVQGVFVLSSSPPTLPVVSIEPVTTFTGTTATFSGHINPTGYAVQYHFEYSADGTKWTQLPKGDLPADSSDHLVSAEATGLEGLTTYQVRLVAQKPFGAGTASAQTSFKTLATPPAIVDVGYSGKTSSSITLEGTINPHNQATSYHFEYVSEADFVASGYAKATSVPVPAGSVSGGNEVVVSQAVAGLTPRATYHFRLQISNPSGSATSPDEAFTMYSPPTIGGLPDGRSYEQATPVNKNGNNAQGVLNAVKAAEDGNGITYFVNGGIAGGEGGQDLPSYVALRSSGDWSTQGLFPSPSYGAHGAIAGYSEDLSRTFAATASFGVETFLTVRHTQDKSVQLMGSGGFGFEKLGYAGTSTDGRFSLIETNLSLAPGAFGSQVYVWDDTTGQVSLAGVFSNGEAPEWGSFAGSYDWYETEELWVGGQEGRFYTQEQNTLSADGKRVFFTASETGNVYMRENPTAAQSPLDGEGNCTNPALACTVEISASQRTTPDPKGTGPVAFMFASKDGGQVFLSSTRKLTDDATTGPTDGGRDLYRYDVASGTLTDMAPDGGDTNGADVLGVLGASADGSYVYFAANGVLAPGAAPGDCNSGPNGASGRSCNVYLWHEGAITFVTTLDGTPGPETNWEPAYEGVFGNAYGEKSSRVTPDGKTLLFMEHRKVYRYDATDGNVLCVSCDPTGDGDTQAALFSIQPGLLAPRSVSAYATRNLSADGNRVFFETSAKLVPGDENGVLDVYEWEAPGSGSCSSADENGGCLYLISTGTSPSPSYFADASASGSDAFFFTAQPLVGQDRDELVDIYDARVGGGIASQNPSSPSTCQGESCREGASVAPNTPTAGTSTFSGPGNPKANHKKKQRKKKRHRHRAKSRSEHGHHHSRSHR